MLSQEDPGSQTRNPTACRDHREYLGLGGQGFMLGDGGLKYGRESASETYYTAHVKGGLYLAAPALFRQQSGFNRDRGLVVAPRLPGSCGFLSLASPEPAGAAENAK
jgi:hypothetical protein